MIRVILGTLIGLGFLAGGVVIATKGIAYGLEKGDDDSIMVGALGGVVFWLIGLGVIIAVRRRRRRADKQTGAATVRAMRWNMMDE